MSFMQPQISEDWWIVVDTTQGIQNLPIDLARVEWVDGVPQPPPPIELEDYLEVTEIEDIYSIECRRGFGARMSAPGYLDCTEWTIFDTEKEAAEYLLEYYGSDEEEFEEDWEDELREEFDLDGKEES